MNENNLENGQNTTVNPISTPQKVDQYDAILTESKAAREITKPARVNIVRLSDEFNAQAMKEGHAKGPIDMKKWFMINAILQQPITIRDLKESYPELAANLMQPVIEKDDLVEGDDLATEVTDTSLINEVQISRNPDAVDYLGVSIRMSLDPSGSRKQTVKINTHGDEGYAVLNRIGNGREIEGAPGSKYETVKQATRITKMVQDVRSLMGTNMQRGNVSVIV